MYASELMSSCAAITSPRTALSSPCTESLVSELSDRLFPSFSRAGHRLKGEQYLRGLLTAPGRKSVRNIARALGDSGAAQRLHHFVCNAPWSWQPVRAALAAHLTDLAPPQAWVVRPLLIPKSGTNSVGVHRRFVPETGQVMNGQQAHGLWYARQDLNAPVDWVLSPPSRTVPHPQPVDLGPGRRPVTSLLATEATPPAPILWDTPAADTESALRSLATASAAVRLSAGVTLQVLGPSGRPALGPALPVERLVATPGAPWLRTYEVAPGVRAVTARVAPPGGDGRPQDGLLLYAQWRTDHPGRADFWLTTLTQAPAPELHRLTDLADQVARDTTRTGARVGLRDFEGRSYAGWHRHMTLASAAYAALMLGGGHG
ncbi:transposase [Streptomyces sp. NBC_01604]|uniref:IS701 family transposase n=1 Tax=Streptomyces sp. NBC_01604 TaxID=2975894 RepID=UPI003864E685